MRLGQLARKLELSPTEIIAFLKEQDIPTSEGSNTRLSTDHVTLVCRKFDPTDSKQIIAGSSKKEEEIVTAESLILEPEVNVAIEEVQAAEEIPSAIDVVQEIDVPVDDRIEVIKAPKVELSGLKILGKIELPEPKKKEATVELQPVEGEVKNDIPLPTPDKAPPPERKIRRDDRKFSSSKSPRRTRDNNPIAAQREREAHEAARKREEETRKQKEKRTQHYLQKVKSVPTKAARIVDEDVVEMKADNTIVPKTWLGKFWKWFRS